MGNPQWYETDVLRYMQLGLEECQKQWRLLAEINHENTIEFGQLQEAIGRLGGVLPDLSDLGEEIT